MTLPRSLLPMPHRRPRLRVSLVLGGGVARRVRLFAVSEPVVASTCLGLLGRSGESFCTRPKLEGQETCGTKHQGHGGPNTVQESGSRLYISMATGKAFTSPCLSASLVDPVTMSGWLQSSKTAEEWRDLFAAHERGQPKDDQLQMDFLQKGRAFQTPSKRAGVDVVVEEADSFEPTGWTDPDAKFGIASGLPEGVPEWMDGVSEDLSRIGTLMRNVGREVQNAVLTSASDFENADFRLIGLGKRLGDSVEVDGIRFPSVWGAVGHLASHLPDKDTSSVDVSNLASTVEVLKSDLAATDNVLVMLRTTFFPKLLGGLASLRASQQTAINDLRDELTGATKGGGAPTGSTDFNAWLSGGTTLPTGPPMAPLDPDPELAELRREISALKAQLGDDTIQFGSLGIRNFWDADAWVTTHLPDREFGYFLDGHSVFQFLEGDSPTVETTVKLQDHVEKIGLRSLYEARVLNSFQCRIPGLLGSDSSTAPLSKLKTPAAWDRGNRMGLRHDIKENLVRTKRELAAKIETRMTDKEANLLAKACWVHTEQFVNDMMTWFVQTFSDLKDRGGFEAQACWDLACALWARVLKELSEVRSGARDVKVRGDSNYTATMCVWATLKTHDKMDEFMAANFVNHQSLASEYTTFLVHHASGAGVDALTDRVSSLEADLKEAKATAKTARTAADKALSLLDQLDGVKKGTKK